MGGLSTLGRVGCALVPLYWWLGWLDAAVLLALSLVAVIENFGYRQINNL